MHINVNEITFPILACLDDNVINDGLFPMLDDSGYDEQGCASISKSFPYFIGKKVSITYVAKAVHKALFDTGKFLSYKSLLQGSPEHAGLLLLPETFYPDFRNVPSYVDADAANVPLNAILYSWLSVDNHDRISGVFDSEDPWLKPQERTLLIIPINLNQITQATDQCHLISSDEVYGWEWSEREGRAWYGKVHDYVMSFLILDLLRGDQSGPSNLRTMKYIVEYVENPYGNQIKIIDFLSIGS